jgi:hypothetical protein
MVGCLRAQKAIPFDLYCRYQCLRIRFEVPPVRTAAVEQHTTKHKLCGVTILCKGTHLDAQMLSTLAMGCSAMRRRLYSHAGTPLSMSISSAMLSW